MADVKKNVRTKRKTSVKLELRRQEGSRVNLWVRSDSDGEIKVKMDRRKEEGKGFNELMTVLTTRCLLSPAQPQPMK